VIDRQRKFEGDINSVQFHALQWLMADDLDVENLKEENRAKLNTLITNPQMYEKLFGDEADDSDEIKWVTPRSAEDIEQIMSELSQYRVGSDKF